MPLTHTGGNHKINTCRPEILPQYKYMDLNFRKQQAQVFNGVRFQFTAIFVSQGWENCSAWASLKRQLDFGPKRNNTEVYFNTTTPNFQASYRSSRKLIDKCVEFTKANYLEYRGLGFEKYVQLGPTSNHIPIFFCGCSRHSRTLKFGLWASVKSRNWSLRFDRVWVWKIWSAWSKSKSKPKKNLLHKVGV